MTTFNELGLIDALLQAVADEGYTSPSPIQEQAIPAILEGRDVMAAAQTGTGKTAGFTLPLLQRLSLGHKAISNHARALILTPTRELASQVCDSVRTYGKNIPLSSAVVFGGVKINPQMMRMRRGVDILVATPGRLLDLANQNAIKFKHLEVLVLDEADRMLDMGFIHDLKKILALLPKQKQTLLFSATFSDEIRQLAQGIVHKPVEISVTPRNATAKTVKQKIHPVDKKQKPALLLHLIQEQDWNQVLVFTKTKHGANKLAGFLEKGGVNSAAIHGNKSQGARTRALAEFKSGEVSVLVATDIAARGLDIDQLPQVVNFDLPNVSEDYVHRIGRTGRAGMSGQAVSLVSADEFKLLADIERLTKQTLEREYVDGFEPEHDLPQANSKPGKFKSSNNSNNSKNSNNKKSNNNNNRRTTGNNNPNSDHKKAGGPKKDKPNNRNPNSAYKSKPKGGAKRPGSRPRPKTTN